MKIFKVCPPQQRDHDHNDKNSNLPPQKKTKPNPACQKSYTKSSALPVISLAADWADSADVQDLAKNCFHLTFPLSAAYHLHSFSKMAGVADFCLFLFFL